MSFYACTMEKEDEGERLLYQVCNLYLIQTLLLWALPMSEVWDARHTLHEYSLDMYQTLLSRGLNVIIYLLSSQHFSNTSQTHIMHFYYIYFFTLQLWNICLLSFIFQRLYLIRKNLIITCIKTMSLWYV